MIVKGSPGVINISHRAHGIEIYPMKYAHGSVVFCLVVVTHLVCKLMGYNCSYPSDLYHWHWRHDDVIKWKHFPRYCPFVRESTGDRWIPLTKARDAELWWFLWPAPEQMVEQRIETPVPWYAIARIMTSLECWDWPSSSELTLKYMGKIDHYATTTRNNRVPFYW